MAHARIFTDADLKRLRRTRDLIDSVLGSVEPTDNGASAPRPRRKYKRRKPKAVTRKPKAVRRYRRDEAPPPEPQTTEEVSF